MRRLAPFSVFYVAVAALFVRERSLGLAGECVLALSSAVVIAVVVWAILGREHRAVVLTRLRRPFHA